MFVSTCSSIVVLNGLRLVLMSLVGPTMLSD